MTWCLPAIHIGKTKQASSQGEPWPHPHGTSCSSRGPISGALRVNEKRPQCMHNSRRTKKQVGPKQSIRALRRENLSQECEEQEAGEGEEQ